jgi:hypothetical protein
MKYKLKSNLVILDATKSSGENQIPSQNRIKII